MSPLKIVIAERGWAFVGRVSREADQVVITDASVIRNWGTTKGIGQLAQHGPQAETVLDACPTVEIHVLAVVAQIACDEAAWSAQPAKAPRSKR